MNRKIAVSALTIFAVAAAVVGATTAFFSDTETSTGNTFVAGAIDLLIDNESYNWNGEEIVYNGELSWTWADLTDELFFDFEDIKPGDFGEDTISIHVNNNESWACAAVTLTSDRDNDCTEPENADDPSCGTGDLDLNGDLADELSFLWWADDEDNVFESERDIAGPGETIISGGALGDLPVGQTAVVTLADSQTNIFDPAGGPLPEDALEHIGKGWCFGDINPASVPNDSQLRPDTRDESGFTCDGASVIDNASQTDGTTLDVSFYAVQARNNPDFTCSEWTPPTSNPG